MPFDTPPSNICFVVWSISARWMRCKSTIRAMAEKYRRFLCGVSTFDKILL